MNILKKIVTGPRVFFGVRTQPFFKKLWLKKIKTQDEFKNLQNFFDERVELFEKPIADRNKDKKTWFLDGYCEPCEKTTSFLTDWSYSYSDFPNFRERLVCSSCSLNNRQRFIAAFIKKMIKKDDTTAKIYLYEQVTDFFKYIKSEFNKADVIGSEYLGHTIKSGEIINGIRHEDALRLSFDDNVFDIVVSNDVYEHVPEPQKALKEVCRILRENGKLIFSVPFHNLEAKTKHRAIIKDNNVINILPEQYHGNPISDKGSLVFNDLGWDIIDMCYTAGFKDAYMLAYYSPYFGYIGGGVQFCFIAEK